MLPFTADQFFSVFAAYNHAIWPAQIIAYLVGAVALWAIFRGRSWTGRVVASILGIFWVWNGLVYHLASFSAINPAAYGFAAMLVLQGLLFICHGTIADRLAFKREFDWRSAIGLALIVYAVLIYGVLGYILGHAWPNAPVFGVAPCPTTIFTFGVLMLAAGPLPIWLVTIPVFWAVIGATAAVLLGVPEDLGLLVSGVLGAILLPSWYARPINAHVDA